MLAALAVLLIPLVYSRSFFYSLVHSSPMYHKSRPPHRPTARDSVGTGKDKNGTSDVKQARQDNGHHDELKPPCPGSWCKKISFPVPFYPTLTTHPPVPAPPSNPASIPTRSAVVNSATQTEGPVTNSPPPTVTSTQVDPVTNSDAPSSTIDNLNPGNGDGPTDSGPGGSVLPSSTDQFGVPFGSDPTHGITTGSGTYNTGSPFPALSSNAAKGPNVGAIVGGILGTIFFGLLLVLWLIRRRKKGRTAPSAEFLASPRRPFTGSPQFQRIGSTYENQSVVNSLRGSLAKADIPKS